MAGTNELSGPNLAEQGIPIGDLSDGGMVTGHDGERNVVLVRIGDDVYALGSRCTHYGSDLGDGAFDGATVRCPRHHAAFDVRTGAAVRPPALNPVPTYRVVEQDGRLYVRGTRDEASPPEPAMGPASVVIVGAGAAGATAAEALRGLGYAGPITMLGAEDSVPVDRPNLSKDYLAGAAPEEWIPLRSAAFYEERSIDLRTGVDVVAIDRGARHVELADGTTIPYGALLLAMGAEPIRLDMPGADADNVFYLRSLADSNAVLGAIEGARSAVVVGASFIGLEAAASLRKQGLDVHVVAPEAVPMERVLGRELGTFIQSLHEDNGVTFHLGHTLSAIGPAAVTRDDGAELAADIVIMGVGVRPRLDLAADAGLDVDRGVVCDDRLRTSDPHIWAAGDIASFPHPRFGRMRVEHWVVAERQGRHAARTMLGANEPFHDIPFFWSEHYDVTINYVGHATSFDATRVTGSIPNRDAAIGLVEGGAVQAVATIGRDRVSLDAEIAFEQGDDATLEQLTAP